MKNSNAPLFSQAYINEGHGRVVILLHGLFGNVGMWKKTIDSLRKDYKVVVPRLPIFELPALQTNIHALVNMLHEFIEWHDLRDVTLVGHSMGGQIALLYASAHPGNVRNIVLVGSFGLYGNSLLEKAMNAGHTDYTFVEEKVNEAFYEPAPKGLVEEIFSTVQNVPRRLILGELVKSSSNSKMGFHLNKLDHRVLLVWGLEDRISPPETALHYYDVLQNSELKYLDKCGHIPMIERPDIFNRYLREFMD